MKIQILGSGCPKCKALEANARAAAAAILSKDQLAGILAAGTKERL